MLHFVLLLQTLTNSVVCMLSSVTRCDFIHQHLNYSVNVSFMVEFLDTVNQIIKLVHI